MTPKQREIDLIETVSEIHYYYEWLLEIKDDASQENAINYCKHRIDMEQCHYHTHIEVTG